jgi:hypothetical protein
VVSAESENDHAAALPAREDGERDSFDALLRRVAHVSEPALARGGAPLAAGTLLAGGRLSIARKLGEGGMGVVYEAFDAQRKGRVALKTLNRLDAASVYRLKNEFRALADLTHENLVRLHELFAARPFHARAHAGATPRPRRGARARGPRGGRRGVLERGRARDSRPGR